jgi:hypothetical protein
VTISGVIRSSFSLVVEALALPDFATYRKYAFLLGLISAALKIPGDAFVAAARSAFYRKKKNSHKNYGDSLKSQELRFCHLISRSHLIGAVL